MKIELAHDIIARKVYDMASTEDKMRLKVERFIKEEHSHYRERKILLQKKELDYINPYLDDITLTDEQKLFIEKSEKLIRWKQLRSLVSMAAFAVLIGIFAVYQSATKGKLQAANRAITESETKFKLLYCLSEAKKAFNNNQTDLSFRLSQRACVDCDKPATSDLLPSLKEQIHEIQQSPLRYRLWHQKAITGVDFSADQKYYVTSGRDGKATLWNSKGEWLRRFLHQNDVVTTAFTPDSRQIFTASLDSTACFWGVNGTRDVIMKADQPIHKAILSPNGSRVFTMYGEKGGKIWSNKGGTVRDIGTRTKIIGADFMPDGKRLLFYEEKSNVVFVWTEDNESIVIIPTSSFVISAQFSPRDGAIMVLTKDGTIRFWNNGNIRSYFPESDNFRVKRAKLSPTGNFLLVANGEDEVELWKRDGSYVQRYEQKENIADFNWSSDGALFAIVDEKGLVEIRDNKGLLVDEFDKKRKAHFIKFSPNNKFITFLDYSNFTKIWTIQENLERTLAFDAVIKPEPAFIQYTNNFIVIPTQDDKALLWNTKGQMLAKFSHEELINSIDISASEDKILTSSEDGKAIIWDTVGKKLEELLHKGSVISALFSPNGQEIITISTGNRSNTLRIWNIKGDKIEEVELDDTPIEVKYSPDGKYIALVVSGQLILMDNKGNELKRLEEGMYIETIDFSQDGKHLAALQGALVKVWNLATPDYTFYELEHNEVVNSVDFSHDNKNILTSSDEGKVRYWDINGNEQFYIDHLYAAVGSASFSSDDKRIVTTTSEGKINIFDLVFDKDKKVAKGATQQVSLLQFGVRYATFSPSDDRIISIADNQASIWQYITLPEIISYYDKTSRQLTSFEEDNYELER